MSNGGQHLHKEATEEERKNPHSITQMHVPLVWFLEQCGCKVKETCRDLPAPSPTFFFFLVDAKNHMKMVNRLKGSCW